MEAKTNYKLKCLYAKLFINQITRSQRLKPLRHVARIKNVRLAKEIPIRRVTEKKSKNKL